MAREKLRGAKGSTSQQGGCATKLTEAFPTFLSLQACLGYAAGSKTLAKVLDLKAEFEAEDAKEGEFKVKTCEEHLQYCQSAEEGTGSAIRTATT